MDPADRQLAQWLQGAVLPDPVLHKFLERHRAWEAATAQPMARLAQSMARLDSLLPLLAAAPADAESSRARAGDQMAVRCSRGKDHLTQFAATHLNQPGALLPISSVESCFGLAACC